MQLRENVLSQAVVIDCETHYLELAALAVQADLGDYSSGVHHGEYFHVRDYLPGPVIERLGDHYVHNIIPSMHRHHRGLTRSEAEVRYIRQGCNSPAPHNMHLYRMKKKKGESPGSVWLGICCRGLFIYQVGTQCRPSYTCSIKAINSLSPE